MYQALLADERGEDEPGGSKTTGAATKLLSDKGGAFFVGDSRSVPARKDGEYGPEDGDQADDEEGESGPVDKLARSLVLEDGQETQADDERACDVALRVPHVTGGGGFEEEEREKDDNLGDDASLVGQRVDTERLETGDEKEHDNKAVVEAKGKVNKHSVGQVVGGVVHFERSIAVRDGTCDE